MVKSKAKKAEKTKVKLKTALKHKTKFLPKGGNVTKTDFKIKPIVIQTQLKEKSTEQPLSKRNLTFKELLTRLNHHNVNVKSSGCDDLSELIKSTDPQLVEVQLHVLLQGVSKLLLDREAKVRRLAVQLIGDILAKVSLIKLEPFFEILIMYTVCAMTHLDVGVQEDSLLIIDAFLKNIPSLIAKHYLRLFPNFLRLISKLRSESNPSRTLTLNLQGSSTSIRWRINVLSRLEGILKAIVDGRARGKEETVGGGGGPNVERVAFGYWKFGGGAQRSEGSVSEHLDVLIPLLNEAWVEALPKPDKQEEEENTIINNDTASILRCTLGIFHLFWELLHESDKQLGQKLLTNDNQKYFSHVFSFFPYAQKDAQTGKIKGRKRPQVVVDANNDPKCIGENLVICYMFSALYKNLTNKNLAERAAQVVSYLNVCLMNRNYVRGGNVDVLLKTLRVIFFENSSSWAKRKINLDLLLGGVVHFYAHNQLSVEVNVEIIKLLANVVHLSTLNGLVAYRAWLRDLPKLLCESTISLEVVDCLSLLSRMASEEFGDALAALLPQIFENLPKIEIKGAGLYPPRFQIVNMFALVPHISQADLALVEHVATSLEDGKLSRHIRDVFRERDGLSAHL
ncbi:hypothetical protein PPYR_12855 [Photinus pyralis]|uniref:Pre-rRNA-processing protein Ipi1 N-terminal domain-containing protein n=1 Tax=Photinus pyralis TaxID=7054 RepID=A0A1Y1NA26_PHOPY|nr:testis-expressed protein 10 [Photinus pyralis]KAB0793235.1 hypothetical protein PPYR_12855 [Photinus pyralis]